MFSGFFPLTILASGTVVAGGLIGIGFIIDLITKTSKGIRLTGFIFIFFLTAALTSFANIEFSRNRAENKGEVIITAAYKYKTIHGYFPKDIMSLNIEDQLKKQFIKELSYTTDSTLKKFELVVYNDGWQWTVFRSKDSTWVTED